MSDINPLNEDFSGENDKSISQEGMVKEFFANNPHKNIPTQEAVDWIVKNYQKRTGKTLRDPDRAIRKLHQRGFLIKVATGVYRYDPSQSTERKLEDFTNAQKKFILERDGYKCVVCGAGIENGAVLHVDHIKAKDFGGLAVVENGQVLCSKHNFMKKNSGQTETGKKMFIRLYELAKKDQNLELIRFCEDILSVFDGHNINGHIEWKK